MTKEPKLEAAVRIVPEWQDYDQEIKQLQVRFQKAKETGATDEETTAQEPSWEGEHTFALRKHGFRFLFCLLQNNRVTNKRKGRITH